MNVYVICMCMRQHVAVLVVLSNADDKVEAVKLLLSAMADYASIFTTTKIHVTDLTCLHGVRAVVHSNTKCYYYYFKLIGLMRQTTLAGNSYKMRQY